MRLFVPALLALTLGASAAHAAGPQPDAWVWEQTAKALDAAANRDLRDPDEPNRAPDRLGMPTAQMFTRIDVNDDGVDDWRVNYEFAPNASLWCGSGGCRNEIWVSQEGHHPGRFMEVVVGDLKLTRRGAVTRLDLQFHGSVCGGYGVQECQRSYLWTEGGFEEVANRKGGTWLHSGPAMLVPLNIDMQPDPIRSAVERMQTECRRTNGRFDPAWQVESIPDLDGDGFRDWVVGSTFAPCEYDAEAPADGSPDLPIQILVTAGKPAEPRLAWEGANLSDYGLVIGPGRAVFHAIPRNGPACEFEKPCGRALRWDEASGKLVD